MFKKLFSYNLNQQLCRYKVHNVTLKLAEYSAALCRSAAQQKLSYLNIRVFLGIQCGKTGTTKEAAHVHLELEELDIHCGILQDCNSHIKQLTDLRTVLVSVYSNFTISNLSNSTQI